MVALEEFGRIRLSKHFFMRDFLYSEIANFHAIPNLPDDPDLAIASGERLAQDILDPLFETFGNVAIRSSYRSPVVNGFGNLHGLNCARNEANYGTHIWDRKDKAGHMGAMACIVIPWFADQYDRHRDWRDLAWWVHDHLPYSTMYFFPVRAAFNISWHPKPLRQISSYIAPKGHLLVRGAAPADPIEVRKERYSDFPAFRGIRHPAIPPRYAAEQDGPG